MIFSLDVWQEIIAHYDTSETGALFSLATVSRSISDFALKELWYWVSTLELLEHVINASAPDDKKIIGIVQAGMNSEESWVLFSPLSEDIRSRVRSYLSRIHHLSLPEDAASRSKESSLWRILSLCVDHNLSLLPSLRGIHVYHSSTEGESIDITFLIPILSSSTEELHFHDDHINICIDTALLLQLIKSRGCNIREIFFDAFFQPMIIDALITCFPRITKLTFITQSKPEFPKSSTSISDLLASLPDLEFLQVDLRNFPLPQNTQAITHYKLASMYLDGEPKHFEKLFHAVQLPSLKWTGVVIWKPVSLQWKSFFDGIAQCCRNLISLQAEIESLQRCKTKKLCFDDLLPISSLPLVTFELEEMCGEFSADEIDYMLSKWLNLETLILPPTDVTTPSPHDGTYYPVLVCNIAKHPTLEEVTMDIDFESLVGPEPPEELVMSVPNSRVWKLNIRGIDNFPREVVQMYTLARTLLGIFPSLNVCYVGNDEGVAEQFKGFQKLVDCLRAERRFITVTT